MKRLTVLTAVLLVSDLTTAREFSSSKGFSLEYPDHWIAVTGEHVEGLAAVSKQIFSQFEAMDFSGAAVEILDTSTPSFAENINIIVSTGRVPLDSTSKRRLADLVTRQYSSMGMSAADVTSAITTIGKHKAISLRWSALIGGKPLMMWQVGIPGNGRTYIVTCTANRATFAAQEPVFRGIIESMEFDIGLPGFWYSLPDILRALPIAAALAALLASLVLLNNRRRRQAATA